MAVLTHHHSGRERYDRGGDTADDATADGRATTEQAKPRRADPHHERGATPAVRRGGGGGESVWCVWCVCRAYVCVAVRDSTARRDHIMSLYGVETGAATDDSGDVVFVDGAAGGTGEEVE